MLPDMAVKMLSDSRKETLRPVIKVWRVVLTLVPIWARLNDFAILEPAARAGVRLRADVRTSPYRAIKRRPTDRPVDQVS